MANVEWDSSLKQIYTNLFERTERILLRKVFAFAFNFPAVFSHQWEDENNVVLTYLGTNPRHSHNPYSKEIKARHVISEGNEKILKSFLKFIFASTLCIRRCYHSLIII